MNLILCNFFLVFFVICYEVQYALFWMKFMKKILRSFFVAGFLFFLVGSEIVAAEDRSGSIAFDIVLATEQKGALSGKYDVRLCIRAESDDVDFCRWEKQYFNSLFSSGYHSFVLSGVQPKHLEGKNTIIQVEVNSLIVDVPISA